MVLLFLALLVRGGPGEDLRQTSGQLLQHLSLLFVLAGTGIVIYGDRIAARWLPLVVALFLSTFLALAVTAGAPGAHPSARSRRRGRQIEPEPRGNLGLSVHSSPLLGLTLTLLAYQAAFWIYKRVGFHPIANPVLISVAILASLLARHRYALPALFRRRAVQALPARPGHGRAGDPAPRAVAAPEVDGRPVADRARRRLADRGAVGRGIGALLGGSRESLMSLAPKSVTTPIAMGVAERIGGLPSLTAVLVISAGIIGAVAGRSVLNRLHIGDHAVRGFAIGIASARHRHRARLQVSEQAGAFAALAMGLNGLITAVSLPGSCPGWATVRELTAVRGAQDARTNRIRHDPTTRGRPSAARHLPLARPQPARTRPRDAAPTCHLDGVLRGGRLWPHRHRRHLLRQDYLGLSAAFLAALGFWAGIPWALKMPIGHLVDLLWRWKGQGLVYLGATLIAASLLDHDRAHRQPGCDARGDADRGLVRAVGAAVAGGLRDAGRGGRRHDGRGRAAAGRARRADPAGSSPPRCTPTTQTLGRVAIIGGGAGVGRQRGDVPGVRSPCPGGSKVAIYRGIYELALIIPCVGERRAARRLPQAPRGEAAGRARASAAPSIDRLLHDPEERPRPTGGSSAGSRCSWR